MRSVSLLKEEEQNRRLNIIKKSACKRRGAISNASNAGTDKMSQYSRSRRGTIPNPLASAGVNNQFASTINFGNLMAGGLGVKKDDATQKKRADS